MSARPTVSYLRRRFAEVGLEPNSRHGQNFLIDLNLLDVLVREANVQPDDVILEVGTGTGGLTARLAQLAKAVVTIEIDSHLFQMAGEDLVTANNVVMLHQDVLKNKNNIHSHVLDVLRATIAQYGATSFKLIANLPYNIATPIISNLLLIEPLVRSMTVTIQKELADRILARPSTKDYSALSVWIQSQCDAQLLRVLPPEAFWPRPLVHSAFLQITPNVERRARIPQLPEFQKFVRALFIHRRKFLRSVLRSAYKGVLEKQAIDRMMTKMQLGPDSRSEQLSIPQMLVLFELAREETEHAGQIDGGSTP